MGEFAAFGLLVLFLCGGLLLASVAHDLVVCHNVQRDCNDPFHSGVAFLVPQDAAPFGMGCFCSGASSDISTGNEGSQVFFCGLWSSFSFCDCDCLVALLPSSVELTSLVYALSLARFLVVLAFV